MADLVFGSPVTTMAILSRIETSRQDEAHLRFGAQVVDLPSEPAKPSLGSSISVSEPVQERQLVGAL
jgi:hypothetical protein